MKKSTSPAGDRRRRRGHPGRRVSAALELPIRISYDEHMRAPHGKSTGRGSILVVDDQQTIRHLLSETLTHEGYTVETAASAEEALRLMKQAPADAVISDERMPGMSGTSFLAVVRKKFPETIRIVLTGYATLDSAIKAINEGEIYRFFTKPCNLFDLVFTIGQALDKRSLERENQRLSQIVQRQETAIARMEKKYPGISRVKKDRDGAILLDLDEE